MARDTDRLLETLARGNARRLQYDQMEAQREAQDQATGMRLQQDAANRIDQGVQFAQGQANHEQARGDALAHDADQASRLRMQAAQNLQLKMQEMAAENARHAEGRLDAGRDYELRAQQGRDVNARAKDSIEAQKYVARQNNAARLGVADKNIEYRKLVATGKGTGNPQADALLRRIADEKAFALRDSANSGSAEHAWNTDAAAQAREAQKVREANMATMYEQVADLLKVTTADAKALADGVAPVTPPSIAAPVPRTATQGKPISAFMKGQ